VLVPSGAVSAAAAKVIRAMVFMLVGLAY
jgi:hypothetical protein